MSYRGHGPLMRTNSHRKDHVFVFGSNLAGIHGAGAALYALKFCGAISGRGEGFQGRSYALPTKRSPTVGMTVREVHLHVQVFLAFAAHHPEWRFEVTRIGCGRAGFTDADIAPLFVAAPDNCLLPEGWRLMGEARQG